MKSGKNLLGRMRGNRCVVIERFISAGCSMQEVKWIKWQEVNLVIKLERLNLADCRSSFLFWDVDVMEYRRVFRFRGVLMKITKENSC